MKQYESSWFTADDLNGHYLPQNIGGQTCEVGWCKTPNLHVRFLIYISSRMLIPVLSLLPPRVAPPSPFGCTMDGERGADPV